MIQQQTVLFIYWSASSRLASMIADYGTGAGECLLNVRVSGYCEGSGEAVVYEVRTSPPAENTGSAYIRTEGRKGFWQAELGMLSANRAFLPFVRSVPVYTGGGPAFSDVERRHAGHKQDPFPLLPLDYGLYSTYTIYPPPKQEGEKP
ncbi:DUF4912 domain-containing protein [Paenibacillus sp. UNC499MF]|uniref:DUF4912 domain-containing protein n=1 Tax=Paenibacillus sp. UNC499MF TaxID=1502751 RepID=UPI0008A054AE|nr:DUF4912 domain-containing protein [Paenibacillus sp. UNC499MF]SEF82766.1 hypothetical protein SAMN02799616_01130 [Paenibacillus sp. UNC499MF]